MSLPFNPNANPTPVYLARVPETPQNQPYEPQRVRVLENAAASLIVDNDYALQGGDRFNFKVAFPQSVQNIRRLAVGFVQFSPLCGNVNLKNNVLRVIVTTGAVGTYTITFTPGYYNTGAAFVAMMNPLLALALPGLTVAWLPSLQRFQFSYNGIDTFYLDPTSSFILYGNHTWGFPSDSTPTVTKISEYAALRFNTQLVIRSNRLTQYEKNNSSNSNAKASNHIAVVSYTGGAASGPDGGEGCSRYTQAIFQFPTWRTYEPQTQLTDIDVEILDEWGDSPISYTDSPNTWEFIMEVITNV